MAELKQAAAAFQDTKLLDRAAPKLAGGAFAYAKFQVPAAERMRIVAVRADGTQKVLVEDAAPPSVRAGCVRIYEVRVRLVEDVAADKSTIGVVEAPIGP